MESITFEVLDCTVCQAECLRITDFVLVDLSQNLDVPDNDPTFDGSADYLVYIEEGDTFDLAQLEQDHNTNEFALLCVTWPRPFKDDPFPIGSVGLRDNNYRTHESISGTNILGLDYNSEGSPPYTLADDNSGDYRPTALDQGDGSWSVTCQAFCGNGLTGESSIPVTRTFQVNF